VAEVGQVAKALRWARERALAVRRAPLPWIAAAAVSAALVVDGVRRYGAGDDNGPRMLVARHPVPIGQPITTIDFTSRMVEDAPPEAMTDQDLHRLRGFRTIQPLAAGETLVRSAVAPKRELPLGKRIPFGTRAYALDRNPGIPLAIGDHVDVFGGDGRQSSRVAENLPIVAVSEDGTAIAAVPDPVVRLLEESRRRGAVTVVLRRPDEPFSQRSGRGRRPALIPVLEGDR